MGSGQGWLRFLDLRVGERSSTHLTSGREENGTGRNLTPSVRGERRENAKLPIRSSRPKKRRPFDGVDVEFDEEPPALRIGELGSPALTILCSPTSEFLFLFLSPQLRISLLFRPS